MSGPQAVVLAGGLATRLGRRARRRPKFLLPVAGRPFAAWVLERLHDCGFTEVILCIGHLGEAIVEFVGNGSAFGLQVRYACDGPELLGTGGALKRAVPLLAPLTLVTYGDSFLPFDYAAPLRDLERHRSACGTMAVFRNDDRFDRSNVRVEGERCVAYRKRDRDSPPDPRLRYIDYGALALRRETIASCQHAPPFGLDRLQAELAREGSLRALVVQERFYEVGSAAGLAALDEELRRRIGLLPHTDPRGT